MGTFTDIIEDPIETETLLQFSTGPVSVQHLACNACSHWLQWAQLATTQLGQKKNSYIHHHKQSGSSYTAHQYNIYLYAFLSCFDDKSELSLKQKKTPFIIPWCLDIRWSNEWKLWWCGEITRSYGHFDILTLIGRKAWWGRASVIMWGMARGQGHE